MVGGSQEQTFSGLIRIVRKHVHFWVYHLFGVKSVTASISLFTIII
jgi:hypothetical protein